MAYGKVFTSDSFLPTPIILKAFHATDQTMDFFIDDLSTYNSYLFCI